MTIASSARLQNPASIRTIRGGMAGKFEISKRAHGEFRFNLKAGNWQVILTSEGCSTKSSYTGGIGAQEQQGRRPPRAQDRQQRQVFLNLTATNGQVIGCSRMNADEGGRDNGIASV